LGGAAGTASLALGIALVGAFYGCSSSSPSSGTPENDAGNEPDAASSGSDATSPVVDSGSGADTGTADTGTTITAQKVAETKLFSNLDGGAPVIDPNLQNPWGLAFAPTGTVWISENGTDLLAIYPTLSTSIQGVAVTPPGDAGSASPSGQLFNANSKGADGGVGAFKGDLFIASTESGTIAGWQPADVKTAVNEVDNSSKGAVYKGLTVIPTTPPVLAAVDFHNNKIDLFDSNYAPIAPVAGKWVDSTVPVGFAPFNIAAIGTSVYVAYAKQDDPANAMDDAKGAGNGALSVFQQDGTFVKSLISAGAGGTLNSPWAITAIPAGGWGSLPAGALLVGNFGDGTVGAYDATSGAAVGRLVTTTGAPLILDGLWALVYGVNNPDAGISTNQLFFTAGPNDEANGLYGYLTPTP
jgi:uncharacterized protein (TIGR03118 family)